MRLRSHPLLFLLLATGCDLLFPKDGRDATDTGQPADAGAELVDTYGDSSDSSGDTEATSSDSDPQFETTAVEDVTGNDLHGLASGPCSPREPAATTPPPSSGACRTPMACRRSA